MTTFQKIIKYLAIAFAVFLTVNIIGGALGAVGLFSGFFGDAGVLEDAKTYTVSGDITALDIEISAADFTIKQADAFSVESNLKNLTVTEQDGTLTIREQQRFGATYNGATLTLCIPADVTLQKAEITTGAGRVTVDTLSADTLKLELGAGEVNVNTLIANVDAEIDGGAGKMTVADGVLRNLDLDMGVGQLNLTAALIGNSDLDLGVGESNLTLIGDEAEYAVEVEKGLGGITVDGETVSAYHTTSGTNRVDIDGGVGSIHLRFLTYVLTE